jgi:hypothetical protein
MKVIKTIILLFFTANAFSQLAVVNDADGYLNVRFKADKNGRIDNKLLNNEVVFCFEPEGNWINVDYKKNNEDLSGYIYKNRVKYISNFTNIKPVELTDNRVKFKSDSVCVQLLKSKFISKQNKLSYRKNNEYKFLYRINGKLFFGTDGEIPKYQYEKILITIGKDTLKIPVSDYIDLYEPNLNFTHLNFDDKNQIYYLSALNSDGAGGYEVVWVFEKGKYYRRYIYYGF